MQSQSTSPTKERLNKNLHPEWIHSRSGPEGRKQFFLEGHNTIKLANAVFGRDGWTRQVIHATEEFDNVADDGRVMVSMTVTMRVTLLKSGSFHEDVGFGMGEHATTKQIAAEKARFVASFDGMKRALRKFGNVMGNCLYDQHYLQRVETSVAPSPKKTMYQLIKERPETKRQHEPTTQEAMTTIDKFKSKGDHTTLTNYTTQHRPTFDAITTLTKFQAKARSTTIPTQPSLLAIGSRMSKDLLPKIPPSLLPQRRQQQPVISTTCLKKNPVPTPPAPSTTTCSKKDPAHVSLLQQRQQPPTLSTICTPITASIPTPAAAASDTSIKDENTKRPTLVTQGSFALDEEDKTLFIQMIDEQPSTEKEPLVTTTSSPSLMTRIKKEPALIPSSPLTPISLMARIKNEPALLPSSPLTPVLSTTCTTPTISSLASTQTATVKSPPSTKDDHTERPALVAQDSFALDEEDDALFIQMADAQMDLKLLQQTCRENSHPPTITKSYSSLSGSPSHQ